MAIFGNFINRVIVLTNKYWNGQVPKRNKLYEYDKAILENLSKVPDKVGDSIEKFKFREALSEVMNLARLGNKYLADTEPWKLIKSDEKRTETILNISIQIAASLALLSEPFMPFSSKKLKKILNIKDENWLNAGKVIISNNHNINKAEHLFKKIEDEKILAQLKKLNS